MEWLLVSAVALVFSCFFEVSFGEETTKGLSECLLFTNVLQLFLKFLQVFSNNNANMDASVFYKEQ